MSAIVELAIRSSVVLLVGMAAAALLRRRSAALRHAVLASTLVAAAAVVPLATYLSLWEIHVPMAVSAVPSDQNPPAAHHARRDATAVDAAPVSHARIVSILVAIWAVGFLVCAMWLASGFLHLARTTARARPVGDARWHEAARRVAAEAGVSRRVTLLQTDAPRVLATWGVVCPRVLLPAQAIGWSDARIQAVLAHELAHIRRHDWLVQIAAELLRTFHWYNPLVWVACARLRAESERAADDEVLARGMPARDYAEHLLEIARTCRRSGSRWAPAMTMARPSTLEGRIAAMLSPHIHRGALSRRALAMTAAVALGLALPITALRASQSAPLPLTGVVYDVTGAVLPGVELTLEGAGGVTWQTRTVSDGRFEFPPVQPGLYGFGLRLIGFRALRHEVELKRKQDWDRAITLQVGELTETVTVSATRLDVSPAVPQAPRPQRVLVGGNIRVPTKVRHVSPVYPDAMREAGREGQVLIEAVIGVDGDVHAARVLGAHVHPDFAGPALEAVRQWQFTPTLLNAQPVEVRMTVTIDFSLAD